jgi:predicted metal-dependent enzyme (double-stranded beta helix superfamily)
MSVTDEFIARCVATVTTGQEPAATVEVVEQALRDQSIARDLSLDEGVRILHNSENLTILHVVMSKRAAGIGDPIPHNHSMWAAVGVTHGSEHNQLFRRSDDTIEPSGVHVIEAGSVFFMDEDTIHSVKNPSAEHVSSALHVYGGDLIGAAKSMWCAPGLNESPFDFLQVVGS